MNDNDTNLYLLISKFFETLRVREFAEMQLIIEQLNGSADASSDSYLWSRYFQGIVAEEHERDWAKAKSLYESVIARNPTPVLNAHVLLSLGIAYANQADWKQSIDLFEESARLWDDVGDLSKKAMVLRQFSISIIQGFEAAEFDSNMLVLAKSHCEEAIEILKSDNDALMARAVFYKPNLLLYQAITLEVLGAVNRCIGEQVAAIDCFDTYYELAMQLDNKYHIATALGSLGDCYQLLGQKYWLKAGDFYEQALIAFREIQELYDEFRIWAHKGILSLKMNEHKTSLGCFRQALGMIEEIRSGITSEAARIGFFGTVENIYANTILAQFAASDLKEAFNSAERSRSRAFLDSLTTSTWDYSEKIGIVPITISELQSQMQSDSIVLKFCATGLRRVRGGTISQELKANTLLFPESTILLFAVASDTYQVFDLAFDINFLVPGELNKPVEEYFLTPPIRQALYQKLIAPAAHLLQNKRRLYIIPHGPLHYVPFHALIAPDGDTLLRDDGPEIVYAPSATILFREMALPPLAPRTCLAVGYNGDEGWQLRFAEDEATHIAHMAEGEPLVGETSKKDALYAQSPNFQVLHFSCHGEFDPDSPLDSRLHIGPNETLTGQEIMDNLRLNCNLVTLSACESGLSRVQRGDELYGLIRAFMYAGAPAIIATLWRVDERSTLIFAQKFYELDQQDVPYATALKAAQLYLRNLTRREAAEILAAHMDDDESEDALVLADKYLKGLAPVVESTEAATASDASSMSWDDDEKIFADPRYWAPFVLIGDPHIQRQAGQ